MTKFNELKFHDSLHKALDFMKYSDATKVQEQVIPLMVSGENVVCKSHTGSGKTLAFGIPAADRIIRKKSRGVLILGPTRELVVQVKEEIYKLNKYSKLKTSSVYGGHGINLEISTLKKGVDILSATPGRLLDHFQRRSINPKFFDTVILDEADRILDMGFLDDIRKILTFIKPDFVHMFSATLEGKVARVIKDFIPEYKEVSLSEEIIGTSIIEKNIEVKSGEKFGKVVDIIEEADGKRVLIFVSTKRYVDTLADKLSDRGYKVASLHGDKSQRYREMALNNFKTGKKKILIATDVAARGLQVDNVEYVINFDSANDDDTHKHRIGRTGRMGNTGYAVNFLSKSETRQASMRKKNRSMGSELSQIMDNVGRGSGSRRSGSRTSGRPRSDDRPRFGDRSRPRSSDRSDDRPRFGDRSRPRSSDRSDDRPRFGDRSRSRPSDRSSERPRSSDRPSTGAKGSASSFRVKKEGSPKSFNAKRATKKVLARRQSITKAFK